MRALYDLVIHEPLYNAIVGLLNVVPGANLAVAVVLLTLIVRLILFPLSKRALVSQIRMRELQPQIEALREKHKENPQQAAMETFALYKAHGVKPFASFGMILVQLPIFIGLYWVFSHSFAAADPESIYGFVRFPEAVNPFLFGIDLQGRSYALALVAAIAQHVSGRFLLAAAHVPEQPGFQADFTKAMRGMSLYFMPVLTFTFSAAVVAALPLYWTVGSIFTIGQELYLKKYRRSGKRA